MRCVAYDAAELSEPPYHTTRGYQRFRRPAVGKQFNERSGRIRRTALYPSDVIALVLV